MICMICKQDVSEDNIMCPNCGAMPWKMPESFLSKEQHQIWLETVYKPQADRWNNAMRMKEENQSLHDDITRLQARINELEGAVNDITSNNTSNSKVDLSDHYDNSLTDKSSNATIMCEFKIYDGILSKYSGNGKKVFVPEGVTAIGDEAFAKCDSLQTVVIPEGVTSIGENAFNECKKLSDISIPNSIEHIGRGAFSGTSWLEKLRDSNSFKIVDHVLIDGQKCSGNVIIPNDVTTIGENAFLGNLSIHSVKISDDVTVIEGMAFSCSGIESIVIPNSVKKIGKFAFSQCKMLRSVVLPNDIKHIDLCTFDLCKNLTEIFIPDSVESIESNAFRDCYSLRSISIPYDLDLDENKFPEDCRIIRRGKNELKAAVNNITSNNTSNSKVDLSDRYDNSLTDKLSNEPDDISDFEIDNGTLIKYCGNRERVVVPEGVTHIGGFAFSDCKSLQSVVIPEGVTSIKDFAFDGCKSLQSVVIPGSVTSIGSNAFSECTSLQEIVIPDSVTSIGSSAFSKCTSLQEIVIPDSIKIVGTGAFMNCSNLRSASVPYNFVLGKEDFPEECKFICRKRNRFGGSFS